MRYLNQFVARTLNAAHGRWENFWAPGSYSAVRLVSPEDVVVSVVSATRQELEQNAHRFAWAYGEGWGGGVQLAAAAEAAIVYGGKPWG
jgi:hypothetical protein